MSFSQDLPRREAKSAAAMFEATHGNSCSIDNSSSFGCDCSSHDCSVAHDNSVNCIGGGSCSVGCDRNGDHEDGAIGCN